MSERRKRRTKRTKNEDRGRGRESRRGRGRESRRGRSGKRSITERRAARESRKNKGYLKLPSGVNKFEWKTDIRQMTLMPYEVTNDWHPEAEKGEYNHRLPFMTHKNVGPNKMPVVCLQTKGESCPICQKINELSNEGVDWDDLKDFARKDRALAHIVMDGEHYVIDETMFDEFFFSMLEDEEAEMEEDHIAHSLFEVPIDLSVRARKKKGNNGDYVKITKLEFDEDESDEEDPETLFDLADALKILSYEELEKIITGSALGGMSEDDEDDEDEEDEYPEEEPEDEEDEYDDEEEEEEEPAPRRTRRKKKPAKRSRKKRECPEGGEFGESFGDFDECEGCPLEEACDEAGME